MNKISSKIAVFMLLVSVALGIGQVTTEASDTSVEVCVKNTVGQEVFAVSVWPEDAEDGLQRALDYIKDYNEDGEPWTIEIPEGEYVIDNTLNVYSNTTLDLSNGVTILRDPSFESTMIRFGRQEDIAQGYDVSGYDAYENISIIGAKNNYAVLDGSATEDGILRFAHATNVNIKYIEFTNVTKAHHVEFAGCKDVVIEYCKFTGYNPVGIEDGNNHEALQLDILMEKNDHFPNYPEYDGTMNQKVKITNNVFENLNRGVGCHSGQVGKYMDDIVISSNTFKNVNGYAIVATNFVNSKITDNKIENCGSGIYFRHITNEYINYYEGDNDAVETDMNSVISNNEISIKKTTFDNARFGIRVYGENLAKSVSVGGVTIPKGDYRVENIKIEDNTISSSACANGIWLHGVIGSTVADNEVSYKISSANNTEDCDGIKLKESTGCNVSNNTIKNPGKFGIILNGKASCTNIVSNTITSPKEQGIYVADGATVTNIKSNTITNSTKSAIYVNGATVTTIAENTLSDMKQIAIGVAGKSVVTTIEKNKITNAGAHGVYAADTAKVATVTLNNIASSKAQGIYVAGKATMSNITSNTITDSVKCGIYVSGGTVKNISSNTINKIKNKVSSTNGIYITSVNGKMTKIASNKVSNAKKIGIGIAGKISIKSIEKNNVTTAGAQGIYLAKTSKTDKLYKNTITSSKDHGVYITDTAVVSNIEKNTVKKASGGGIVIKSTKTTSKVTGNTITSCKKYGLDCGSKAKITAKDNTITSCKSGQVRIQGSKNKTINTSSLKIKSIAKSKKGVVLKWTKIQNVKNYVVYRSTSKNGTYKKLGTTTSGSYTDKKAKKNKTYYYKLVPVAEYSKTKIEFTACTAKKFKVK